MGRHAGWIAASAGLAAERRMMLLILFFSLKWLLIKRSFLNKVKLTVKKCGYCVIVVSEGAQDKHGKFLADSGSVDSFGHAQLGRGSSLHCFLGK